MLTADLYLDKINFLRYLPGTDCQQCGEPSCNEFVQQLQTGATTPDSCPFLSPNQVRAFQLALQADRILPEIPALELPRPATTGLMEVNQANGQSLVLVSGNSEFTQQVLSSIIAYTLSPFWLLFVDCRGDTVDMAMVYQSLTAENIAAALQTTSLSEPQARREMVLPGFALPLREPLERLTNWQVRVGPMCIAELPLFLGEAWVVPADLDLGR
jgi:CO dehydrogenase/acetyl-CoA synthase gamma subunit (corrinoid Fe-S protein)